MGRLDLTDPERDEDRVYTDPADDPVKVVSEQGADRATAEVEG